MSCNFIFIAHALIMPHESPKREIQSGAIHLCVKMESEFGDTPCDKNININRNRIKDKKLSRMIVPLANGKENENGRNVVENESTTCSKAPIPEHIYDPSAKTFYKLGQFLGKVNSNAIIFFYINFVFIINTDYCLNLGRFCVLLSSFLGDC